MARWPWSRPLAIPILLAMIEAHSLTKRLGGRTVVDDVSFRCEPGTVTGFLGPNGAGKTTTMRMLCGLLDADAGAATVLGGRYRDLPNPGRRVGILLDAAAQHGGRRGQEALDVSAQTMAVDERRVGELLELVGLDRAAARKRVRQYSLGMRQRLGLAHALLGDPEVLILDEPANGLDPEGMRWMRRLLRDFADRGGTVLLSSHLLYEVEAIADRLVIIGGGRIAAQGSRADLLAGAGTPQRRATRPRCWPRSTPPACPHGRRRTAASSSTPNPRTSAARRSPATSRSRGSARPRAPASSSCSST
jgi:ABC-2 type transport system ATP-binding protein